MSAENTPLVKEEWRIVCQMVISSPCKTTFNLMYNVCNVLWSYIECKKTWLWSGHKWKSIFTILLALNNQLLHFDSSEFKRNLCWTKLLHCLLLLDHLWRFRDQPYITRATCRVMNLRHLISVLQMHYKKEQFVTPESQKSYYEGWNIINQSIND